MVEKAWGRKYRNTTVCIDSYENSIPVGFLCNPYLPEAKPFTGVTQFLKEMEQLLNDMKQPQSFTAHRSFSSASFADPSTTAAAEQERGALATFQVNVIFRQNASWQGTVTWTDRSLEENFRSVLDLILLMDSALQETTHPATDHNG
ncbi:MAG: hypothetical protein Q4C76_03480 [Bacillota bacterium]|nr:hypothetical protein [Bacillota bacterium]